jgi:hypothetical protein
MARARPGTGEIRRATGSSHSRRARVPTGSAHALSRTCRKRARLGDHGRPRCVHGHRARRTICGRRDRERARSTGRRGGQESFVRTFAYASGPAYGLLLDASSPDWTRRVRGTDDLATVVARELAVQPATDATASATRYGGADLRGAEQQRAQQRQERVAELRQRFVDGPVLLISGGGSGSFDARGAVSIPGIGTVYFGAFRSSGNWGTLEAEKGVLVASDGGSRRVPEPVRRDDVTWLETDGPLRLLRDGSFAKEHGRATTKWSDSRSGQMEVLSGSLVVALGIERRQFLREVLDGPIQFTPDGRQYRFAGEDTRGGLIAGLVGLSPGFTLSGVPTGNRSPFIRCEDVTAPRGLTEPQLASRVYFDAKASQLAAPSKRHGRP